MKKCSIATLCALSIASSLLASPSALAKDVQLDTRNNKEICIITLDAAEQEIAKKYFALKIEEQIKVQNEMRKEFPEYRKLFKNWDNNPQVHENLVLAALSLPGEALTARGYESSDGLYMFFTNSKKEADLKEWAANGYPYVIEVARNWSYEEKENYPATKNPVIFTQDGVSLTSVDSTLLQLPAVYKGLQMSFLPSPRLKTLLSPGEARLKALEDEFKNMTGRKSLFSYTNPSETPAMLCEAAHSRKESGEEAAPQTTTEDEKKAAEAKRKAEEAAKKAAEEAARQAAEAKRKAEEAAKKAEEEKRKAEEAKKPKPSTPNNNAKPAVEGSSTAGIVGIVLGVLALVGGAAFALLPQLRGALNLKF